MTEISNSEMHEAIEVYIDGSGSGPDGHGSGFAWTAPKIGKSGVIWKDGLTNNQAEYGAFLAAIGELPKRSAVVILTDSQLLCEQFNGRYQVRDATLAEFLNQIRSLIHDKLLDVQVRWIPRSTNLADKLLKRNFLPKNSISARTTNSLNVTLEEPLK